jgi:hypothetical protein
MPRSPGPDRTLPANPGRTPGSRITLIIADIEEIAERHGGGGAGQPGGMERTGGVVRRVARFRVASPPRPVSRTSPPSIAA